MKLSLPKLSTLFKRKPDENLTPLFDNRGWFRLFERNPGDFQKDIHVHRDTVLAYHAVFACITLIAQDIGKLRAKLVSQKGGIWQETTNPAYSPLLRKPNHFQTRIKFFEYWITSKLVHGNAYALKVRDNRGVVVELYLLDPCRVVPLVAEDGSVFYRLQHDRLSLLPEQDEDVIVPAREIIHDPMVTLFHPLIGVSPLFACGLGAIQGVNIQRNSARFFKNMSRPSGILTAPGEIKNETAARVKEAWEKNYGGENIGRTAVLGDGLKYEAMAISAVDAQLIEQLKWTAEMVCSCFHVPSYMVGVGTPPAYNNIEALNQQYYAQCLQSLIESLELSLDEGMELVTPTDSYGVEFDLDGLLRMDTAARYKAHSDGISGGWLSPNEARQSEDLPPINGGETPYMQQQNFSLAALAARDAAGPPSSAPAAPAIAAPPSGDSKPADAPDDSADKDLAAHFERAFAEVICV